MNKKREEVHNGGSTFITMVVVFKEKFQNGDQTVFLKKKKKD